MQRLEVSGVVRLIYGSLGVKRLTSAVTIYSMYLRLNIAGTPDVKFCEPQHCTVLDQINR